jgi:hypothetical protein
VPPRPRNQATVTNFTIPRFVQRGLKVRLLTFDGPSAHRTMVSPTRIVKCSMGVCLLVLGALHACGSSLQPAGTGCASDGECGAGLTCLGLATLSDAGCSTEARTCSKVCRGDSDCLAVGANFKCFASCEGTGTCGRTQ